MNSSWLSISMLLHAIVGCTAMVEDFKRGGEPIGSDSPPQHVADTQSNDPSTEVGIEDTEAATTQDTETTSVPAILTIEATGQAQQINPTPNDLATWESYGANRKASPRRIDSIEPKLVIAGENLMDVTRAIAVGQNNQGTIEFAIEEAIMNRLTLKFPATMAVTAGGLFLLTLSTAVSSVDAQVFFLQGEKGDKGEGIECDGANCTLPANHNLVVSGDISGVNASYSGNLNVSGQSTLDWLTVDSGYWLPDCPQGYEKDFDTGDYILCRKGLDEIVKVGNFWIDRYEISVWEKSDCTGIQYGAVADDYPDTFPDTGNWTEALYACSVKNYIDPVIPSRYMTWFQAQQACVLSGKALCSNAEWQAAATDTHDPGESDGSGGNCRTRENGPRATGLAASHDNSGCTSVWGAEDMIGNLWEWADDWYVAGRDWMDNDGQTACSEGSCDINGGWPEGYGSDMTMNVNGTANSGGGMIKGAPVSGHRGGAFYVGSQSGIFALVLNDSPAHSWQASGTRCCLHR